ncbi:EexN family lipoprotein [Sphingomonas sp. LB2R24]|uniref:EexN family lipoprotein n=1 Tax=Sphingomonas sorbitolis TaxID=3096165 RepID=UPI002FC723A4
MRVVLTFIVGAMALAGCSENSPIAAQPRSLDFFKANTAVRKKVMAACKAAQGTHAYQPEQECGTAQIADQQVARENYARERTGGK